MSLRIGSFCTGYGGLDEAVQRVFGGELAWVSDIDPGACKILAHRHPTVPNLGDLTAVDWSQVEPVDIVTGGYPCQPFSLAGDLKGTADERHIWPGIARALGVLRPRLAVFENVANHLRLGFDTVLADLAHIRFDAEWCLVRADEIGASHQRKRLIFLARPSDPASAGQQGQGLPGRPAERGLTVADAHSVRGDGDRAHRGRRAEPAARHLPVADPAGVGAGEPADQAQSFADRGDAREVPGCGGVRADADADRRGRPGHGELSAGRHAVRDRVRDDADRCCTPATDSASVGWGEGWPEPAGEQGRSDAPVSSAPNWGAYGPAVARWERVIGRSAPSPTNDLGRLNPAFVEWMMGLAAGHVTAVPGLTRTQQLKALGNGVVPQQAEAAIRLLYARATS
ncbi:DNA cytosine methyltransferase [Streptomyces xanthochromogenes]|uniref:DNA cytosine methyltransferase n=1 Tax=Streptomyces xanthochromogenes TaxID=67384 RepID=UPI003414EF2B